MSEHHLADPDHTTPSYIRLNYKFLFDPVKFQILSISKPQYRTVYNFSLLIWIKIHSEQWDRITFLIVQGQIEQMSTIEILLFPIALIFIYIQVAAEPHQLYYAYLIDSSDGSL